MLTVVEASVRKTMPAVYQTSGVGFRLHIEQCRPPRPLRRGQQKSLGAKYFVPKPQLEEVIAWFKVVHNYSTPASDSMKHRLKHGVFKYGNSL